MTDGVKLLIDGLCVLDEKNRVVPIDDVVEWAAHPRRKVRVHETYIGAVQVSTMFLGNMDLGARGGCPFETMVRGCGHPLDQEQEWHRTWAEAEAEHVEMVTRVIAAEGGW